jgi:hypothetical protein
VTFLEIKPTFLSGHHCLSREPSSWDSVRTVVATDFYLSGVSSFDHVISQHDSERALFGVHWHSKSVFDATSGRCCTNAIRDYCCVEGHSCIGYCCVAYHCTNMISGDFYTTMGTLGPHSCATVGSSDGTSGLIVGRNATDRHGRARKVFLSHARAWGTRENWRNGCQGLE